MTQDEIIEMAKQAGLFTHKEVQLEILTFAKLVAAKERLAQPEQEPPNYSFKAHWESDGRIGVVAAIMRPDGGVHLLQDFIDPPQLTKEKNA